MICDDLHAEVATLKNRIRETEDQLRIGREEIAEYERNRLEYERKHVQAVAEFERKHQQTVAEYERTRLQQKKENQALAA